MADPDLQVQSILLGPDAVEVSYIERRHVGDHGMRIQTIRTPPGQFPDELGDLLDAVEAFIAAYDVAERNPAMRVPSRRDP